MRGRDESLATQLGAGGQVVAVHVPRLHGAVVPRREHFVRGPQPRLGEVLVLLDTHLLLREECVYFYVYTII